MNIRLFIAEIKKRAALWDQTTRHYHDKQEIQDGWLEVANNFQVDVITAKQKWKNLRDTFRVELKKFNNGKEDGLTSMWAYYNDMFFLKDTFKTRLIRQSTIKSTPMFEIVETNSTSIKTEEDTEITLSPVRLTEESHTNNMEATTSGNARNESVDTTNGPFSKRTLKRKRVDNEYISEDDNGDDLLFFRSLLPFVKRLDEDKKLLFRLNVQQMLYNQLYDHSGEYNN